MEPLTYEQRVDSSVNPKRDRERAKKARARRRAVVQKASRKANRKK